MVAVNEKFAVVNLMGKQRGIGVNSCNYSIKRLKDRFYLFKINVSIKNVFLHKA